MVQFRAFAPQIVWCVADSANIDRGHIVMLTGVVAKNDPTPNIALTKYVPKVEKCTAGLTSCAYGVALEEQDTDEGWVPIVVSGVVKVLFDDSENIAVGDTIDVGATAGQAAEYDEASSKNDEKPGIILGWACEANAATSSSLLDVFLIPKGVGIADEYV